MARERKFSIQELFAETREIILQNGYEGFTFSVLADCMNVSRGTLYKYYENKEGLITEYIMHEMNSFLGELKQLEEHKTFEAQFDFIIDLIFKNMEIHQLIMVAEQISKYSNEKVKTNKEQLKMLHFKMFTFLRNFVVLGKKEGKLRTDIPDELVLGFVFQTINIPNHHKVPLIEWVAWIKEILRNGMFTK